MFVSHQKMFNLTCVERIVDQNFNKAIFSSLISKDLAHFDGEVLWEQALSHCWWCFKLIQYQWRAIWQYHSNYRLQIPFDTTILLLGIDLICGKYSIIYFSIICNNKDWKQPVYPRLGLG